MKLRIKKKWIIVVVIILLLSLGLILLNINQDIINSPKSTTKNSKQFHYFIVNVPYGWRLVSNNYISAYQSEKKIEEARFRTQLGDRKFLDISIRVDNAKQNDNDPFHTSKKQILLNGEKVTDYVIEDCGGGKGMGSYCEQISLYINDKRYGISLFDYGSRVGADKSHSLFMDFLRNTSFKTPT